MTITRRGFLVASAGFAALPVLRATAAPLPREADIVVIGAGAAGIAAARRIMATGRKVVVLEAASQVGGRCVTDSTTFDTPFERGARWMYNPDTNPMIRLARSVGLDVLPAPSGQKMRIGRRNARAGETEQFLAALVRANRAIDEAARAKLDTSCASVLPKDLGDWAGAAEFMLGASFAGKDLKELSAIDKGRAQDRNAAIACRQGLGTLITKLGEQVPVALATPASRIAWSSRDVSVETQAGKIGARAAAVAGRCREPAGSLPERSRRNFLTIRSSRLWKVTTASRPPGLSTRSAAASPSASSSSSRFTWMRIAWKVRVAGSFLSCGL